MISDMIRKLLRKRKSNGDGRVIDTIIGEGVSFGGKLTTNSSVRVDGVFEGDINLENNLVIGERGLVIGNITSSKLTVFGKAKGSIKTQYLEVKGTATLESDGDSVIEAQYIEVEKGAVIQCKFNVWHEQEGVEEELPVVSLQKQE